MRRRLSFWAGADVVLATACLLSASLAAPSVRAEEEGSRTPQRAHGVTLPLRALAHSGYQILSGVRIENNGSTNVRASSTSFPSGGTVQFLEIPRSAGGGFLFAQPLAMGTSVRTAFYRSETFTGELTALFSVGLSQLEMIAREQSILLKSEHGIYQLELEPARLTRVTFPPYPVEPSEVHFLGTKVVVLEAPLFGVLVSRDDGISFSSLAPDARILRENQALRVHSRGSVLEFDSEGRLGPLSKPKASANESTNSTKEWRAILERGTRVGAASSAISLTSKLTRGEDDLLTLKPFTPAPLGSSCIGFESRQPEAKFLCRDAREFQIVNQKREVLFRVDGEQKIESLGRGGVVLRSLSSFDSGVSHHAKKKNSLNSSNSRFVAILEQENGSFSSVPLAPPEQSVQVLVLDGKLVRIEKKESGLLVRALEFAGLPSETPCALFSKPEKPPVAPVAVRGEVPCSAKLYPFPSEEGLRTWLAHADLVPSLMRGDDGLGLFLTRDDEFVGVHLKANGALEVGPIKRGLSRAILSSGRALLWGAAGYAQESIDGGGTFSDVLLPYQSGDGDPNALSSDGEPLKMGCSSVGCSVGRVASYFGDAFGAGTPVTAPGALLSVPSTPLNRAHFDCDLVEPYTAPAKREDREIFWSEALNPAPPHFSRLVHKSVDDGAYLLSEGPSGIAWNIEGATTIWAHDPFSPELRVSRRTVGLFASQTEAEAALGLLDPAGSTATIAQSADGKAVLYRIADRDRVQEILSVEGQPLEVLQRTPSELRTHRLSLTHHLSETFLSAQDRDSLIVYAKQGSEWVVRAQYPLPRGQTLNLGLATDSQGGLAVTLLRDATLFAFPILSNWQLGSPISLGLGEKTRACNAASTGYLIVTESTLTPDFTGTRGPLSLTRVLLRHRLGPAGGCLDAIAGRARGAFTQATRKVRSSRAIPLVVSDYGEEATESYFCD